MKTIYEYDPDSVRVSFRGVELPSCQLVLEEKPRRGMSFGHVSMTMISPNSKALRCFVDRVSGGYLTPRKRRRIKRRAERGYLDRIARDWYGIMLADGETTASLRMRCRATVEASAPTQHAIGNISYIDDPRVKP